VISQGDPDEPITAIAPETDVEGGAGAVDGG
jgi:hypothetical protein